MTICAGGTAQAIPEPAREVRVLRWTFRRDLESVVCELGLNNDDSAYELRVRWPSEPSNSTELFGDAMSAFHRHSAIERLLVDDGWLLEGFESERLTR
jgi:hypothetical protein